jgi:hypothetical protein
MGAKTECRQLISPLRKIVDRAGERTTTDPPWSACRWLSCIHTPVNRTYNWDSVHTDRMGREQLAEMQKLVEVLDHKDQISSHTSHKDTHGTEICLFDFHT